MNCKRYLSLAVMGVAATLFLAGTIVAADGDDDLVKMVISLLGEKDKDLRAVGLEQVRTEAKGEAATKQFAAQLPKLPPDAQVALLSALADRKDSSARAAVLELLTATKDEPVKVAAVGALGSLGETGDTRLFVQLLAGDSKTLKAAARASLLRLPGDDVPAAIAAELKQAPPAVRVALIETLATRRGLDTIPEILTVAVGDDATVRAAAMIALSQLAGREQIPGMIQGVLKATKGPERDAAERAVAAVCERTDEPQKKAEPLLAAIDQLNDGDRLALYSTLGRVGGQAALKVIEAAIVASDPKLHETGLRALCNWPDASVAPRLIELIETDQHPEHRTMVLAALIRVAPLPDKRPDSERLALLEKALSMCQSDKDRNQALKRARAIRTVETLRFLLPYLEQASFNQTACESVVELAHHRGLREPNKPEFDKALDKVKQISKDPVVVDRANRYQNGQTWVRPAAPSGQ